MLNVLQHNQRRYILLIDEIEFNLNNFIVSMKTFTEYDKLFYYIYRKLDVYYNGLWEQDIIKIWIELAFASE